MATLHMYRFRFRDPRTGRWVTARYRAEAEVIRERYVEHELLDVELREVHESAGYFNPLRWVRILSPSDHAE